MLAACAGAFAQGKVNLFNDPASLVTLTANPALANAADASLLGHRVGNIVPLSGGTILTAALYGGTTPGSLFLYSTFTMNLASAGSGGQAGPLHIVLNSNAGGAPNIPGIANNTAIGAATPWFQIWVWGTGPGGVTYPNYAAALNAANTAPVYITLGGNAPFQMNPGSGIAYVNTTPSGNSSWTDAPIVVGLVPEPSTFALAGLGAAALMIFRRRK